MLRIMMCALLCGFGMSQAAQQAKEVTPAEKVMIATAMPDKPIVKPAKERRVLVFSLCNGFKHSCIPYWKEALRVMAEKTGAFKADFSEDMAVFTAENLAKYDAVCLNNTTGLEFTEPQQKAFMDFVKSGKGVIGIHAATDNFKKWKEAEEMMGGQFTGHPWTAPGTWAIKIDQPNHPLMKMFGGKNFKINDEIYRTAAPLYSRDKQLVLMSLDMSDEATKNAKGVVPGDMDTGISWVKTWGKGRVFYCSLGHNHPLTWTSEILQHYLAGSQFALGDYDVPTTPVPAAAVSAAATAGQSNLDTAKVSQLLKQAVSYEYGKTRLPFSELDTIIAANLGNSAALAEIEKAYCAALSDSATTYEAKEYLCKQLSVFGTEGCVDALGQLLAEPKTQNIARYALQRIGGKKVDQLLLDTLAKTSDKATKLGIISTLGFRKTGSAVVSLSGLVKDADKDISSAVINTLGRIGNSDAAAKLMEAKATVSAENKAILFDALLSCAAQMNAAEGSRVYETLFAKDNPPLVRVAALQGLTVCQPDKAETLIAESMQDKDAAVAVAAVTLLGTIKDSASVERLLAKAGGLSDDQQVRLLASLRAQGQAGKGYAENAAASSSSEVRLAAFSALEVLGDAGSVDLIAKAAAASNAKEQDAARKALDMLSGQDVDGVILKKIQMTAATDQDKAILREMIRTAGQRKMRSAMQPLLGYALSEDGGIRQESVRSLQLIAEPSDMPALVKLLVAKSDAGVQGLVVSVAGQNANRKGSAKELASAFAAASDKKVQAVILAAIGKIGDPETADTLRTSVKSSDEAISQAAFRAMCDWPGMELIDDMFAFAKSSDVRQSTLAIRSCVRMITAGSDAECPKKVDMLSSLMESSSRVEDKRVVIGGLSSCPCSQSYLLAARYLEDEKIKAEAQAAIVSVMGSMNGKLPADAAAILEKIQAAAANDTIAAKAAELITKKASSGRRR